MRVANVLWETFFCFVLQIVVLPGWEYIYIYKIKVSLGFLSSFKFGVNFDYFFPLNRKKVLK